MRFQWEPYQSSHEALVDSWLDDTAVEFTGLDNGWKAFYDYWMLDAKENANCRDYCFLVSEQSEILCVIYLATQEETLTVSCCVVAPCKRGKDYGSAIISELVQRCAELIGTHMTVAEAAVFPKNIASQKAFEKAGFAFISERSSTQSYRYARNIHGESS